MNDIVAATGSTQANVSKHLAMLAAGGVLTRKREGQCVYYGMKNRLVMKLCELVHSQRRLTRLPQPHRFGNGFQSAL